MAPGHAHIIKLLISSTSAPRKTTCNRTADTRHVMNSTFGGATKKRKAVHAGLAGQPCQCHCQAVDTRLDAGVHARAYGMVGLPTDGHSGPTHMEAVLATFGKFLALPLV